MPSPKAKVILEAERRGGAAFRSFQADLQRVARTAGVVSAAAGAALAIVTKRSFEQIDALAKTSDLLGVNVEALAALQLAAELTGNTTRNLNLGLQRMTRRIAEASQGMGEAQGALRELGLDAEALTRIPLEQQFEVVSQALVGVESQSQKVRLGFKLFDSEGVALLRTSKLLATEGLAGITEEARRLGIAVNRVDAAKIEQANDAMLLARSRVQGVGNIISVQLAPIVTGIANRFTQVGDSTVAMASRVDASIDLIAKGVGVVADALHGWRIILVGAEASWLRVRAAAQGFSARFNPEIREVADETDRAAIRARLLFRELALAELPSALIASNMAKARVEAQKAAEQTALLAETSLGVSGADAGESVAAVTARERAEQVAATERAALERRLETTIQFQRTAEESEIVAHQRRALIIQEAFDNELISRERAIELQERLHFEHQERLTQITTEGLSARDKFVQLSTQSQTRHVLDSLVQMTAGVANSNKALFRINKLAAIGSAVVNTAQGVTRALAEYPPPLSFVMAAAQAAAGLAQIQAIKSTSFGGGTTPSVAGTTPTFERQPVGPQFQPQRTGTQEVQRPIVQVNILGLVGHVDEETAEIIGEAIHGIIDDRDFELIGPESAQAQSILSAVEPA